MLDHGLRAVSRGGPAPVAQWIEHLTTDQKVRGSSPFGRTYCVETVNDDLFEAIMGCQGFPDTLFSFPCEVAR